MTTTADTLDWLAERAARGEDVYEEVIAEGMKKRESMDQYRWDIGDLATLVEKRYGDNTIAAFAKAINEDVEKVKDYRRVSAFWKKSVRNDFLGIETLSYSHFRTAMRLKKKGGLDAACAFLDAAASGAWTIERTRIEAAKVVGKPPPPTRLLDAAATVGSWDRTGHVAFLLARGVDLGTLEQLTRGRRVRLVIYEGDEE